jgi:hypothetical protein
MHNENLAALHRDEFDILVEQYGIPVSQHDLLTLTGLNWLNDHIIGTPVFQPFHHHHVCVSARVRHFKPFSADSFALFVVLIIFVSFSLVYIIFKKNLLLVREI